MPNMNGQGPMGYMGPPDSEEDDAPETDESTDDTEIEGKSCLIPKSMLPKDHEIGDTLKIKIEAIFSDEAEISIVSKTEKTEMTADEEFELAASEMD